MMFAGKKEPAVSASRFCRSPLELPYAQLYRYDHFVVAISKLSLTRSWPQARTSTEDPIAYGLLHGSQTFPDHGADEALLPVQVTFDQTPTHPEHFGSAHFDRSTEHGTYLLYVNISDPDGSIARAFDVALSRAIISGFDFKHIRCVRERNSSTSRQTDYQQRQKEDIAFLKRVEDGQLDLELLSFDKVFFDDDLTTKAPTWSWEWNSWEFDQPQYQSSRTAKWRQEWLPRRTR